tara:strand:+ start:7334 stop:7951 length:618 start_codon:yes stop_codon:yes gene_type:complete
MKTVKVYGALKKYVGQGVFNFDVSTPAEAIQALCANFKGLDKFLIDSEKNGIVYDVKLGKEIIQEDNIKDLLNPWSYKDVFSIRPVVQGAGRGFGRFLMGAALFGLGALGVGANSFIGTFGLTKNAINVATALKQFGGLLMLSGAAEMLSPQPELPTEPNLLESSALSGLSNVDNQGTPIPICYGRAFVGSVIISTGLDTDEVAI